MTDETPNVATTNGPGRVTRPHLRLALGLALAAVVVDQISKWWIASGVFGRGFGDLAFFPPEPPIVVTGFFNLVLRGNTGIAFSLLSGESARWFLVAAALAIVVGLLFWLRKADNWATAAGIGLVVGGALGNVIDRVRLGAVVDFLEFHAYGWAWPAFNVADSAVVGGVGLLLLEGFFRPADAVK